MGRRLSRGRAVVAALLFSVVGATVTLRIGGSCFSGESPGGKAPEGAGETRQANRLIKEKSPYLLQHAYNPVDWFPWGKEAFERARKEDKPIFLSIGYSTCHWCHVMERESFESDEIAKYLSEHFVCIKVDREERPDVDAIYMAAVHAMGGRGGWPLSAFLTHDGKPFFAGTYFPPRAFLELSRQVTEIWKTRRDELEKRAAEITAALREQAAEAQPAQGALKPSHLEAAYRWYLGYHDETFGGFGQAPKFPRTSNLDFLMRYAARTGEEKALRIVYNTLDHMIRGGLYDHLGGGFHRYSTDRYWLVPHFEKMLYDNALIPRTLIDAYRVSGKRRYLEVARETLDYLLARMQSPEGGFHSAEDADTEGEEGKTYVWTRAEILDALGKARGVVFADYYGATEEGNFHEPGKPEGERAPLCVLHVASKGGEEDLATKIGRSVAELRKELAEDRAKLLGLRNKRPQPFLDDKILVEWNGLAISAFAHAYQVTLEERYLQAAQRAARFILERMVVNGKLRRRYRSGEVRIDGFLEDYAFFVEGLIDLYEADFQRIWLEEAVRLGKDMVRFFWDGDQGGFFSSAEHHEKLISRFKGFYDGAKPSGNSVAFSDMLRLHGFTGDEFFEACLKAFQGLAATRLEESAQSHPQLLCAAEYLLQKPLEIVVVGPLSDERTRAMLAEIRRRFLPSKVVLHVDSGDAASALSGLVPLLESKVAIGGHPTAFVCRERVCKLPARNLETLRKQLDEAREAR